MDQKWNKRSEGRGGTRVMYYVQLNYMQAKEEVEKREERRERKKKGD